MSLSSFRRFSQMREIITIQNEKGNKRIDEASDAKFTNENQRTHSRIVVRNSNHFSHNNRNQIYYVCVSHPILGDSTIILTKTKQKNQHKIDVLSHFCTVNWCFLCYRCGCLVIKNKVMIIEKRTKRIKTKLILHELFIYVWILLFYRSHLSLWSTLFLSYMC